MTKMMAFFLTMVIVAGLLGGIMQGGNGIVATNLNGALTDSATVVVVESTNGFLSSCDLDGSGTVTDKDEFLVVENERIWYKEKTTTQFGTIANPAVRGVFDTAAVVHSDNRRIGTQETSVIDDALGFRIAQQADAFGILAMFTVPLSFIFFTVPRMVQLNLSFLGTELAIISYFFFAASGAFIVTLGLTILGSRRI